MPRARNPVRLSVVRLEDRITPAVPLSALPKLHSLPGAAARLYLDFDGDDGTVGFSNVVTPAYNTDGDPTTFNDAELAAVRTVWQAVAEDYAPFAVDVTTEAPAAGVKSGRIVVGGNGAWFGQGAGGVANLGTFGDAPAFAVGYVFSEVYDQPLNLATTVSHEAGHTFGLDHQSVWQNGVLIHEYNPGDAKWGPLMGTPGYLVPLSTWWNGTTDASATTFQDDIAVIAAKVAQQVGGSGFRADDHGNTAAQATPLASGASAVGLVNSTADLDVFAVTTGATGALTVRVAGDGVDANLDAVLELRTAGGLLLASADPADDLDASVGVTVAAGTYFITVKSNGAYGRIGQYTVTASGVGTPPKATQVSPPVFTPSAGAALTAITVAYARPMNAGSFDVTADVASFTGPTGADLKPFISGAAWTGDRTLTVNFSIPYQPGAHTLVLNPGVFSTEGQAVDQDGDGTPGEVPDDRFTARVTIGPFADFLESNDTLAAATDVGSLFQYSASGLTVHQPTDADLFRAVASRAGTVSATATPAAGAVDVAILDANGNPLAATAGTGGATTATAAVAVGQVVYVRVTGHDGALVSEYGLFLDNQAATGFAVEGGAVTEFRPGGTVVARLAPISPGVTYAYALVPGAGADDNGKFTLIGNELIAVAPLDAGAGPSLSVRVRATDGAGGAVERAVAVAVRDDPAVALADRVLYVNGTPGNDTFAFAAGSPEHRMVLNFITLAVPAAAVSAVVFDGGGGANEAYLYAAGAGNVAGLAPTFTVLQGAGYAVYVARAGQVNVTLRPGDVAYLAGSEGADVLGATPAFAALSGAGFRNTVAGYATLGVFGNGGVDTAYLFGSAGADSFVATPTYAGMVGGGAGVYVAGFEGVVATGGGGADAAFLADSEQADTIVADGASATLTLPAVTVVVDGFVGVVAYGFNGGANRRQVGAVSFFLELPGVWVDG